jgi:hypothetical protein
MPSDEMAFEVLLSLYWGATGAAILPLIREATEGCQTGRAAYILRHALCRG